MKVTNPKAMAQKSLAAGYVKDAIRYYHQAIEHNPDDAEVAIGLGWAYNIAGDDREAMHWFDRARHMGNAAVAKDADRAYRNLSSSGVPEITVWGLPIYSSRWQDTFAYSQVKLRIPILGEGAGAVLPVDTAGRRCTQRHARRRTSAAEIPVGERHHRRRWRLDANLASHHGMGGGGRSDQLSASGARRGARHSRLPGRRQFCEGLRRVC